MSVRVVLSDVEESSWAARLSAGVWLLALCTISVLNGAAFAAVGAGEYPGEAELGRIKKLYKFEEWSSKLKIPGKEIRKLPAFENRLAKYGRLTLSTPPMGGLRSVSLAVFPPGANTGRIRISLHVLDSPCGAKEALVQRFAFVTFPGPVYERAGQDEEYDLGDVCFYPTRGKRNRLYYARNNVLVSLKGSDATDPADVLRLGREIDQLLIDGLVDTGAEPPPGKIEEPLKPTELALPGDLVAAIEENDVDRLVSFVRRPERALSRAAIDVLAKTPEGRAALPELANEARGPTRHVIVCALSRARTQDAIDALKRIAQTAEDPQLYAEAMEGVLKSMPEHEALRFCLVEAEKLTDNRDADPEKLLFLIRGLRQDYDPPQVRMLRQILRRANDERVRVACLIMLSKWISDASEVREDVLGILEGHLKDESADVRTAIVRALGESRDPRYVPMLAPVLEDPDKAVQQQAAEAICRLLGWKRSEPRSDKELGAWVEDVKAALPPVLDALDELDSAARQASL